MEISLIICTRNRADQLPTLFSNLKKLMVPEELKWEILIVDNGSCDNTENIIKKQVLDRQLPLIGLCEPRKGKSRALNLALKQAMGKLLVFTDDDLDLTPEWLTAYYSASLVHPQVDGFFGKVLPVWTDSIQPEWSKGLSSPSPVDGVINRRDHGEKLIFFRNSILPAGCNAALRKSAVDKMGRFREDIGPGTHFPFAEDTEYFRRLYLLGGQYLYVPDALVYHRNCSDRITRAYFLKWTFQCARSEAQIHSYMGAKKNWTIPLYLYRKLFFSMIRLVYVFEKRYLVNHLRPMVQNAGELIGLFQKKALSKK